MSVRENQHGPVAMSNVQPHWYAVHTHARHEKRLHDELGREGLKAFLPLRKEVHQWTDRKKQVLVPLFSGYVFIHGLYTPELHHAVLRKPGALGFVGIGRQALPIADIEIESFRRLLEHDVPLSPCSFVSEGQRIRICGGSLDGVEGIVTKNGVRKLIVSVEMIQRSVAVHLEHYGGRIEVLSSDGPEGRIPPGREQTVPAVRMAASRERLRCDA